MRAPDVDVVIGMQFGSEGKGGVCQHLLRRDRYEATVRTGGPQAGHTVYLADEVGRFNVLPAGAVVPGVQLVLPPGSIIDPLRLNEEIEWCQQRNLDVLERIHIDSHATVLEDSHPSMEREEGLVARVGGTGKGVTAATSDRLWRRARLAYQVPSLAPLCGDTTEFLAKSGPILIEMTQGYGLSLYTSAGYYPFLTGREISTAQGLAESGINPRRLRHVYGVARTFPIRAGLDSGPLLGELDFSELGVPAEFATTTGRPRRIGQWDAELARRAVLVCGIDTVILTHIDYLDRTLFECSDVALIWSRTGDKLRQIEENLGVQIGTLSTAPGHFVERGSPAAVSV